MVTANDVVVVVDEVNWRVVEAVEGRRGREEENAFTPLETMAATAREAQAIFMVKDTGGGAERAMVTKTMRASGGMMLLGHAVNVNDATKGRTIDIIVRKSISDLNFQLSSSGHLQNLPSNLQYDR